ncbi:hypothetical protein [Sulfurimonas sp.]|uniref:hypothetical protein n=1 Tax=Sulfurimonas sp. TaxID=2022749 RepID=UPI0025E79295|nr:hypothetical protein [Sulfurimonas sp.]
MRFLLLSALLIFAFAGCSLTTYNRPILKGKIDNPDIIITAVDKSFTLKGEFTSPFQSSVGYNTLLMHDSRLCGAYRVALERDAKHVRVKVPNIEKELYGVLALDKADKDGIGPGTDSYKIVIPQPYIDAVKGGKISVVYEYYKLNSDGLMDVSKIKERSWILWVSDEDIFR